MHIWHTGRVVNHKEPRGSDATTLAARENKAARDITHRLQGTPMPPRMLQIAKR